MTQTNHLELEALSAFADGELHAVAAQRVEGHVAECESCRHRLERLRGMVAAAGALPREMPVPSESWAAIQTRLAQSRTAGARPARWWHNGWLAAAAAVVLVVGTALLMPRGAGKAKAVKLAPPTPIVLTSVEKHFVPTITELREVFESQRANLSPSTVRTLERSLAVIDTAIAEARDALAADPASSALVDILVAYYSRKVEFLKRATNLSSSL